MRSLAVARCLVVALPFTLASAPHPAPPQAAVPLRQPLPIDAALAQRGHNGRSSLQISPDGEWVAHTVESTDVVPRASRQYAATGFSFAEGDARMEATLTNTRTREAIRLGGPGTSSRAPVFSPDGSKVAFYSDDGGEAGLWIWDRATRSSRRVGDVILRPFFGFELPVWSSDGTRLLVKLLPAGMTIAQANALGPQLAASETSRFPAVEPGQASVQVRSVVPKPDDATPAEEEAPEVRRDAPGSDGRAADLAILDLASGQVARIVERAEVRTYAFSPDTSQVAYTVLTGYEPASQQPTYDLEVRPAAGGPARKLGTDLRLSYGMEWSFSPDGTTIAYIPSGQMARRAVSEGDDLRIVVVSVADGAVRELRDGAAPSFDPGDGEVPPLWDATGGTIYVLGDGNLWSVDVASGQARQLTDRPDWRIRAIVTTPPAPMPLVTADSALWVVARERDGARSAIWAVDPRSGETRVALQENRTYSGLFSTAGCAGSGEIAFVATDQQHLHDVWLFDTAASAARQVSSLNPEMERYELGHAEVIHWRSLDGEPLGGALLLPPGYERGTPLPMVVWVYAGDLGSTYANRFGFWGDNATFNMHLLATRGYAVLFPDVPVHVGTPVRDLMSAVMPGVNAAIELGYADADRLAIMGQSYGSYNVLAIITQTTRFKAAVITAAALHPDLFADYLGSEGYYEQGQGNMGGSIWEVPERYSENSPLFRFDRITTPLLIGQGENDGDLVPAEAIFLALQRLDKPVEYRLYEGEGHVITSAPNVRDFWQRRLEFLAEHLDLEVDAQGAVTRR